MQRVEVGERPAWRALARQQGFGYAEEHGVPYWVDGVAYRLASSTVQAVRVAAEHLHALCLDLLKEACQHPALLERLGVPASFVPTAVDSYQRGDLSLHGRFDFVLDADGCPKMLEYNADTPTAMFEAATFQRQWLESAQNTGKIPAGATQANALEQSLRLRFAAIKAAGPPRTLVFAAERVAMLGGGEDWTTIHFLADLATQAGWSVRCIELQDIGRRRRDGRIVCRDGHTIDCLYKLYPWEYAWHDAFLPEMVDGRTQCLEPAWKVGIATKGILPLLWERYPDHPNVLPAHFTDSATTFRGPGVCKPLHSREGHNITLEGWTEGCTSGPFTGPCVRQQVCLPPAFQDSQGQMHYAVLGAWIVGNTFAGIGIREDSGPITTHQARFVPHYVVDDAVP